MKPYTIYKRNVIEALHDLSSLEFQNVAWFPNNQGLSSDFTDDVNAVFDDFRLLKALHATNMIVFSVQADQALRELNEICDDVGYDKNEYDLIHSPNMQIVREKAAKALALVLASDGSESTVEIIEE